MHVGREVIEASARWLAGRIVRRPGVICLNYHRIGDATGSPFDHELWSATVAGLDRQLRWLAGAVDVISPDDLPQALRARRGRHVLLTFDDGYRDNYSVAYPLLRRYRLPATFFVTTGFIDRGAFLPWWDELAWMVGTTSRHRIELGGAPPGVIELSAGRRPALRALRQVYVAAAPSEGERLLDAIGEAAGTGRYPRAEAEGLWMTWPMLREMRAGGMTVGGHTISHPILARLSPEEQHEEIEGCGRRLETELGVPMRVFAYPFGKPASFDDASRACLRRVGVHTAFTYHGGFRTAGDWDALAVPRSAVERGTNLMAFQAEVLAPWFGRS